MIAEKNTMVTIKVEEGEMERIFEVVNLLKRIEDEVYGDGALEVATLAIIEEPTGNTLSVNSKPTFEDLFDASYSLCKFFDI